jgi:hypothetical protein
MSATRPGEPESSRAAALPLAFPNPSRFAPLAASAAGSAAGLAAAFLLGGPLAGMLPPSRPLPGFAAEHGIDVRRETFRFLLLVLLPIAGGFAGAALRRRRGTPATPVEGSAVRASARGLAAATIGAHAIVAWIFTVAAVPEVALRSPLSFLVVLAACSAALALLLGRGRIEDGAAFLGAAALMLPLAFVGQRPIPLAAAAACGVFALPTLACALGGRRAALSNALRAAAVAVLIPGSVGAAAAAAILGPPPVADLFENGHELLPASEYLSGERPYRDVVPGHGLISDGGADAAAMRLFGDDFRGYARGRKALGAAFWPAVYAVGLGATGSPLVGLGVALLSLAAFCQYAFVRAIPSLAALGLTLAASRTGERRWWAATGAALAICLFVSVDFAVYAAAGAAAGLWVARGDRSAAFASLLRGALTVGGAGALALLALGVLPEFARVTFGFLPSLLPAYAQGFPPALPLGSGTAATLYAAAGLGVLLLGTLLPGGKRIPESARALPPVCAWIAAAMLAVLERQHLNYPYLAVPALVVLLGRWIRGAAPDRAMGNLAAATVVGGFALIHGALSLPFVLGVAMPPRPLDPDVAPIAGLRRAEGAVFRANDRVLVARTGEMMRRAGFGEGDTWLDFANEPGLYFLFERPCPIRYYEVPFYESEDAQREVIAAVEANPRVRAVLLSGTYPPIDGVPNAARAPLVARFVRDRFRPFLSEDGIEFWIRGGKDAGAEGGEPPGP